MIVVVGSLSFDFVMNFPGRFSDQILPEKIHVLNLSFLTERLNKNYGGTAGNIAYNLSLLGEKPIILATAGKDFEPYRHFLKEQDVVTRYIKIYKSVFTSNYFAIVDRSDNQIGGFFAGAMSKASRLTLKKMKKEIRLVIISPTDPVAMVKLARECQELKIPYLFDPGMQLPRLSRSQILKSLLGAKILIGNDYEISLIMKKTGLTKKDLRKKVEIIITTLAEKGSVIEVGNRLLRIAAAKPLKTSDPVGAGDAYRAGFVKGFLLDFDLRTCAQMGSVTAVYTVEKYGSTTHKFTLSEFCQRYKNNYQKALPL